MSESKSLDGELVFLGTGTSSGVPVLGCDCETCSSDNPLNHRWRCAVALGLPGGTLLIDTPPELRLQLLREGIKRVDAALFTHAHADHLFGFDDVRAFSFGTGEPFPIICEAEVEARIRHSFDYAFDPITLKYPAGGVPRVVFEEITPGTFETLGTRIEALRLHHGRFRTLGFRVGDVAYCTDVNEIPSESFERLRGLDVLILDALRPNEHATHFSLPQALDVIAELKPRRALLTHMSHELEHEETSAALPPGVEMAHDGLRIPLSGDFALT